MRRTLAVTALVVAGCSSSSSTANKPPVLDSLDVPDTVTKSTRPDAPPNTWDIVGTISAHDPDGVVTKARIYAAPAAPFDYDLEGPDVKPSFSKVPFVIGFTDPKPGATIAYEVSVFDNEGAESDHVKKTAHIP